MRNKKGKSVITGLIFLVFYGCNNNQKTPNFVYDDGNNKIEFIIDNGKNYLIFGKPTKAKFIYSEGIIFSVFGPGIKVLAPSENTMNVEITTIDGTLIDDELKVEIRAKNRNNIFTHSFGIPVRESE